MIHRSVDRGDLQGVRTEVAEGASLEATDYRGKTPLQLAAKQGHLEIVEYLVEAGAEIDVVSPVRTGEVTPLRYAIGNKDYLMTRYLIEHGADVNRANTHGWTPIMTAARVGNKEIFELLLDSGAALDARTVDGKTPLRIASEYGWTDIVVWLTFLQDGEAGLNPSLDEEGES